MRCIINFPAANNKIMDENIITAALKDGPTNRFTATYIEDICASSFDKVFPPIDNHEVDFSDEMIKLGLESHQHQHQNWMCHITNVPSSHERNSIKTQINQFENRNDESTISAENLIVSNEESKNYEENKIFETQSGDKISLECNINTINLEDNFESSKNSDISAPKFYKIQCLICKKWFLNNDSMITHIRSHCSNFSGRENFQCPVCQQTFLDENSLHSDMMTHININTTYYNRESAQNNQKNKWNRKSSDSENFQKSNMVLKNNVEAPKVDKNLLEKFKCDMCVKTFYEESSFNLHMTTHTNSKSFKCHLCQRYFSQKTALSNHMLAHSGEKPHACDICEKTYKRKSELARHMMVHTGERPYECKECLMTFREKAKLNSHMLVHTGEKPHECYICYKACARKSDLNSHMLSHTGGQYDCKVCNKIFTRKSDLSRHTLIHTGEKPFACDFCEMAFREKTRLNSHVLIHTGDKNHTCHICEKGFKKKSSLKKHMLIHTGEKHYECCICHKAFIQKTTLNLHMLTHAGDQSYECGYCPKTFGEKVALRKHWLSHVNERVSEISDLKKCSSKFNSLPHTITNVSLS